MQRATAHTLHRRGLRASFTRSGRAAGRHPLSLCARSRALVLARAHAFNYIFASQLPRERKTGRGYRGGVGIPPAGGRGRRGERYAHGRSTWEIVARSWRRVRSRQEEPGDCARSNFITWKSVRLNGRSIARVSRFSHPARRFAYTDRSMNRGCASRLFYLISPLRERDARHANLKNCRWKKIPIFKLMIIFATR